MEELYGIIIPPEFDVHHKDYNHDNDDPDNLIVLTHAGHLRWHGLHDPNHYIPTLDQCSIAGKAGGKANAMSGWAQSHGLGLAARNNSSSVSTANRLSALGEYSTFCREYRQRTGASQLEAAKEWSGRFS
jgi:hypothetical protein